ncbi:MAG TPA: RluA family pseudouridine synthase [Saprospiraceae bacterium]|nr:RluA family pseudouridine synthase [Saprospiraceae bacterium]
MNILFEDADMMVIDKPGGLSTESGNASHPSAEKLAVEWFQQKNGTPRIPYLRAVHRLDRVSGGVLVLAKSKQALSMLMRQFEQRLVKKTYQAVVEHAPSSDSGVLTHWLKRDESGKKALVFDQNMADTQPCALDFKVLERRESQALLEIYPETGRFHQIRAQLAHVGAPIFGDQLYGGQFWRDHEIKLQAVRLQLMHPRTNAPMTIDAPWDAWDLNTPNNL